MKKTFLITALLICTAVVRAQDIKIPGNYKFETNEDYAPYEQDALNCCAWVGDKYPGNTIGRQGRKRV